MKPKLFRAIGLMSGTSIDGIDAALVETDGLGHVRPLAFVASVYDTGFRAQMRGFFGNKDCAKDPMMQELELELTDLHIAIVQQLLNQTKATPDSINVIGFHGQTIWHDPVAGTTYQIGDGMRLAEAVGIPVVNDFRSADMRAGGQGAPLVPLYHRALAVSLPKPAAILNVGGVSNITWIGGDRDEDILACDVGPGNAPLDDWILHHTHQPFDERGAFAATGTIHFDLIDKMMAHEFFSQRPPKSLDRNSFKNLVPDFLSPADGAATLTRMIAYGAAHSFQFMPQKPDALYVTGGGRHNLTLMQAMADLLNIPVKSVDELGWSGDGLEAEAFAYLAVRSLQGLPLSMPGTTGVSTPMTGGVLHKF